MSQGCRPSPGLAPACGEVSAPAQSQLYSYIAPDTDALLADEGALWAFVSDTPGVRNYYDVLPGSGQVITGHYVVYIVDSGRGRTAAQSLDTPNFKSTPTGILLTEDPGSSQQFPVGSTAPNATTARLWYVRFSGAPPHTTPAGAMPGRSALRFRRLRGYNTHCSTGEAGQVMDKPAGWGQQYASAFQEESVAEAYAYRPPYPPEVFRILAGLLPGGPRRILDAGCGTGALARHLTFLDAPIEAVDIAPAMVARGRRLPNGDHPLIRWSVGAVETLPLSPPYGLITAGESLHWMDWPTALPRFAGLLAPGGRLAILDLGHRPMPWSDQLGGLIQRYSTNRDYRPVDLVAELERRGLFEVEGRAETAPWAFRQSLDDYVESFHGRASFSRARMTAADAAAFDAAVRALVTPHAQTGVTLPIVAQVVWGRPQPGAAPGQP